MTTLSRRGLFGLFAGVALAPMIPRLAAAPRSRTIIRELQFAQTGTFTRYSGYEIMDLSRADIMAAAAFDWKPAATWATFSAAPG